MSCLRPHPAFTHDQAVPTAARSLPTCCTFIAVTIHALQQSWSHPGAPHLHAGKALAHTTHLNYTWLYHCPVATPLTT
jgi:hypothetical protein